MNKQNQQEALNSPAPHQLAAENRYVRLMSISELRAQPVLGIYIRFCGGCGPDLYYLRLGDYYLLLSLFNLEDDTGDVSYFKVWQKAPDKMMLALPLSDTLRNKDDSQPNPSEKKIAQIKGSIHRHIYLITFNDDSKLLTFGSNMGAEIHFQYIEKEDPEKLIDTRPFINSPELRLYPAADPLPSSVTHRIECPEFYSSEALHSLPLSTVLWGYRHGIVSLRKLVFYVEHLSEDERPALLRDMMKQLTRTNDTDIMHVIICRLQAYLIKDHSRNHREHAHRWIRTLLEDLSNQKLGGLHEYEQILNKLSRSICTGTAKDWSGHPACFPFTHDFGPGREVKEELQALHSRIVKMLLADTPVTEEAVRNEIRALAQRYRLFKK